MLNGIDLRPATPDQHDWCASLMARTGPWFTYGLSIEWCRNVLKWPGSSLLIAANSNQETLGFALLHSRGFLGNPYIAAIAVAEHHRSRGIGSQILALGEQSFVGDRFMYLCVSSFNTGAHTLYERHGYSNVAELPDFIADGYTEILMRKRLSIAS